MVPYLLNCAWFRTTLDHDEPPHLDASMAAQLEKIAASHQGVLGKTRFDIVVLQEWNSDCFFPN